MIIVEGSTYFMGAGKFEGVLDDKPFRRWWFGWLCISWTTMHLKEFHDYVSSGATIWLGANNED